MVTQHSLPCRLKSASHTDTSRLRLRTPTVPACDGTDAGDLRRHPVPQDRHHRPGTVRRGPLGPRPLRPCRCTARGRAGEIPASDYFAICQNDRGALFGKLRQLGIIPKEKLGVGTIKLTPAEVSNSGVIAGNTDIDKVDILIAIFGGKPSDWVKKKTVGRIPEIHWYQGPGGIKVGMKVQGQHDPF